MSLRGGVLIFRNRECRYLSIYDSQAALAAWFGAFEEPPRMSSERDICLRRAGDAKRRATQATEPSVKSAYEKVAEHWMLLARLESFVAAEKNSEDA
jgi:hypothetical protein